MVCKIGILRENRPGLPRFLNEMAREVLGAGSAEGDVSRKGPMTKCRFS